MEQKSKIEMHPDGGNNLCGTEKQDRDAFGGGNNPCGAKEEDRDASSRGKIIPVEQKSKIEMHSAGRNNPCEAKEEDRDASGRQKSSLWSKRAR